MDRPMREKGYRPKTQTETYIRNNIKRLLQEDGWDVTYHQQGIGSRKGFPDLTAMKDGKTLYIEVKTPTGKQSCWQADFEQICKNHGCTYILARGREDIEPYLTTVQSLF